MPTLRAFLFSLMTSFTKRLGRSFTLRRTWCAGGERDALENDGCASAARGVCDSGQARFAAVSFAVRRVRHFASDGIPLAAPRRAARHCRDRRTQPQAAG